jgi:hypothetical protein
VVFLALAGTLLPGQGEQLRVARHDAIAYCTSLAPGGSNAAFAAQDAALRQVIAINDTAFTTAVHRALGQLSFRTPLLGGAAALLLLCLLGVRPRLREFRS